MNFTAVAALRSLAGETAEAAIVGQRAREGLVVGCGPEDDPDPARRRGARVIGEHVVEDLGA